MKEEIWGSRRYNDNIEKNINFMLDNNEEENIDINGNPSILSILTLRNNNNYNMIKESSFGAKDIFIKFYKLHLLLYLRIIRYNLKNNIVDPINILKYMVNNDVNQNKAFEAQIKMFLTIPLYDEILKKLWIEIIEIFIKYFQSKKIELEAEITNINKLIIEIKKIKPINKILLSENNNKLSTKKEELTKFKKYIDTFGDMLKKINKIKIQIQIKK